MANADTLDLGEVKEDLASFCSTCIRRSGHFFEMKPKGSILVEKIFSNNQKLNRIFHVCPLCKLAIDFFSKFEQLCETSRVAADNWDIIDIRSGFIDDDPNIENALESICQWAAHILKENLRMYKMEEQDNETKEKHSIGEREFEFEKLVATVKAEPFPEEYLIQSDFEDEIDEIDEKVEIHEEIVLEIKPVQKRSRKKKIPVGKIQQVFTCNVEDCQTKFVTQRSLHNHRDIVHGFPVEKTKSLKTEEVLLCPQTECDFKASSQLKLNRHLQTVHSVVIKKTFFCDICAQVYPSKCRLQYHMNCHLNISPFLCDFEGCSRAFRNPTRLRNHKQEFHLQIIRMHCAICGKGFRTKASHDLHILGHDKPTIPCEVCGRLLTNRKTLRTHLMTHTGEKRYKCEIEGCHKAFTKCSGLQVHMRSHTKEKPYKCPQCEVSFAYKVTMKKHMLKFHDIPWETSTHIKPETQTHKAESNKPSIGNVAPLESV